uniref:Fucosyltransferase n=1 Tax=Parastrongyloides trichosuri TaxID=131310 RepID=A0A0N4ZA47_PARTI
MYKECIYSSSIKDVRVADVLLFKELKANEKHIPKFRDPKQLFFRILLNLLFNHRKKEGYQWRHKNFFNMTYTYSTKSDIQKTYFGKWTQEPINDKFKKYYRLVTKIPTINDLKKKKKHIVWTVSDCETASQREVAVKLLRKYIPVNQYGTCNNRFLKYNSFSSKFRKVYENHYFYLALENSDCKDYVTEKYFSRVYYNSIPIVGFRKHYEHIAPKNSFIAMDDFESPKAMAKYLLYLIKNKKEYLKYFAYRKDGWKIFDIDNATDNFCSLCAKLVEMKKSGELKNYHKVYYDARETFLNWTKCQEDGFFWQKWKN